MKILDSIHMKMILKKKTMKVTIQTINANSNTILDKLKITHKLLSFYHY